MAYIPKLILTGSAATAATMDINFSTLTSACTFIQIRIYNIIPVTTNVTLLMRVSADGTTFDTTGYSWSSSFSNTTPTSGNAGGSNVDTSAQLGSALSNSTNTGYTSAIIEIFNPNSASFYPNLMFRSNVWFGTGSASIIGAVQRTNPQAIKGIRLFAGSGNISGNWSVLGYE